MIASTNNLIQFQRSSFASYKSSELLVLPYWCEQNKPILATDHLAAPSIPAFHPQDFSGQLNEWLLLYPFSAESSSQRLGLLGLGEREGLSDKELSQERLRRCFASLVKVTREKKLTHIAIALFPHPTLTEYDLIEAICEGLLLANYSYQRYKSGKKVVPLTAVTLIGASSALLKQVLKALLPTFSGVYLARDLVNGSADEITPLYLADTARLLAAQLSPMKVRVYGKKYLQQQRFGLILSVARASVHEPQLIVLEYNGADKKSAPLVLVGKGVTYDTGGLNLKPTGSMETMRSDMGGAAAVLGTMCALGQMKLPINVTAVIPAVENCIDACSYKPGDVYTSFQGLSVEIANTDAEGRLILADAIAYALKYLKPHAVIDLATLTGAMVIALGDEVSGLMSNDALFTERLRQAGLATYERVWPLPLYDEYAEALKSDIADIKNVGDRTAGAIAAAQFLKKFVGDVPWAHIDIAGTAFLTKEKRYYAKGATGWGVRFLMHYLRSAVC